mgnify:CR=1 FL=1|tara:strand:- start:1042 stop:1410 length:369 start_codon:yes stop_codon:yes gene_type:complete
MWLCIKCNEKNEDSFDSCWKCQTYSDIGSEKSKIQQKVLKEEEEKQETIIKEDEKLEEGIKKHQPILLITSFVVLIFSFILLPKFLIPFIGKSLILPLVFVPSIIVYNRLKSYFKKQLKKNE